MDRATALRKIEELNGGAVSEDAVGRLRAIEDEEAALNSRMSELARSRSNLSVFAGGRLGDYAASKVRELDQQIAEVRGKIETLGWDVLSLSGQRGVVEWQLLDLDEGAGRALVISSQLMVQKPFDTGGSNQWQRSSLRAWLNGEFYASLPAHVRSRVLEAPIDGGKDCVFLLSEEEAQVYFATTGQRVATYLGRARWWWLRSPGYTKIDAAYVLDYGHVFGGGIIVSGAGGVRPALWLDLNA
ncbi:MAG: DUF6273 domain-containing protein [Propionibacteriaceae bacterium]|jgi:hypothetical protein|nr:DUF6273 domain-containing protein [Propionibacteriaceae bacterium]